jgi:FkbM family methyltransferase
MSTVFHGTYIGNDRMLIKTAWGMRLIASCSDMSLMPTLMVDGIIEGGFTNWLIKNQESFRGKNILDVGANIGYFTVLFSCIAGKGGQVVAFEANPKVIGLLKENIYLSQLQEIAEVMPYAVSNSHMSKIRFNVSTKYQGNSSLMTHSDKYKEQFATDEFEEAEATTVALDFIGLPENIELLKIDVEGAEYKVLIGAQQLLVSGRVKYVMFELNKNMLGEDTEPLRLLLHNLNSIGAMFYVLSAEGNETHIKLEDIFANDYIDNILMKLP